MENSSIRFVNHTELDMSSYKAMYSHHLFKRPLQIGFHAFDVAYILLQTFILIYFIVAKDSVRIEAILQILAFSMLLVMDICTYFGRVNAAKRLLESTGGIFKYTALIGDTVMAFEGTTTVIALKDIRRVYVLSDVIYFVFSGRQVCALSRRGFAVGNEAEFLEHLGSLGATVPKKIPALSCKD